MGAGCRARRGAAPAVAQDPVDHPVVTIADMEFQNGTLTVERGTTVTRVWEDAPVGHNVVADDFESPLETVSRPLRLRRHRIGVPGPDTPGPRPPGGGG